MNKHIKTTFSIAIIVVTITIGMASCQSNSKDGQSASTEKKDTLASQSMKPVDSGYAEVNGLKMYYEVYGAGKPIVLLHGSFMTIPLNWS